jgi:hypothetical protein
VDLTVHQGIKHQVKRMFKAVGFPVQRLERVRFAGLTTTGLAAGEWRDLKPREVRMLYALAGLSETGRGGEERGARVRDGHGGARREDDPRAMRPFEPSEARPPEAVLRDAGAGRRPFAPEGSRRPARPVRDSATDTGRKSGVRGRGVGPRPGARDSGEGFERRPFKPRRIPKRGRTGEEAGTSTGKGYGTRKPRPVPRPFSGAGSGMRGAFGKNRNRRPPGRGGKAARRPRRRAGNAAARPLEWEAAG